METRGRWKNLHQQPQKRKGGGSANAPALCEVCLRPSNPALLPAFSHQGPFERLPVCLFRKVLVVRRLSRVFPSASSDVEENCLTPQLSSAVVKRVLEEKLHSVRWRSSRCSIRCPVHALDFHHFGKPREGKVRFERALQSPSLPLPLKSRVCRCLQASRALESITSDLELSLFFLFSTATGPQVSSKKAKWEISGMGERGRRASEWIWLIPGACWTGHEQAWTKSTSPKSTQTQRKRFSCPNGAKTCSNYDRKWCEPACFSSWRQISNSHRMRNICRNGARSEADLAQLRRGASSPPFLWLLVQIFFNAPLKNALLGSSSTRLFRPVSIRPPSSSRHATWYLQGEGGGSTVWGWLFHKPECNHAICSATQWIPLRFLQLSKVHCHNSRWFFSYFAVLG